VDDEKNNLIYVKAEKNLPKEIRIQIGDELVISKNVDIKNGDIIAVDLNSNIILSRIKKVILRYILIDYSSVVLDINDRRILGKVIKVVVNV